MQVLIYLWRIIKAGLHNFLRNGWLSVAATTVMVLTLFTISVFTLLNISISAATTSIQEKIDFQVFLSDGAPPALLDELQSELRANPFVRTVDYTTKAEAVKDYRAANRDNPTIASIPDEDLEVALPTSLEVQTKDASQLPEVKRIVGKPKYKPLIHSTTYQGDKEKTINRLVRITNFIKTAGLALSAIFIVTSLLVIFNTIRIAIFTRRDEIEIMKLVGATNQYIRWPFIIEGATYGAIATLISLLIQYIALSYGTPLVNDYLQIELFQDVQGPLLEHLALIISLQLLVGISIGIVSSWIAIRRYLKVPV